LVALPSQSGGNSWLSFRPVANVTNVIFSVHIMKNFLPNVSENPLREGAKPNQKAGSETFVDAEDFDEYYSELLLKLNQDYRVLIVDGVRIGVCLIGIRNQLRNDPHGSVSGVSLSSVVDSLVEPDRRFVGL
jgi:hypothetical protein